MAVRITHTNNSSGHDGTYVYRSTSPMDPQALPAPIADAPPVAQGATFEYIDTESLADGTYYYRTQDHEGGQVSAVSDEQSITLAPDYASAQIGDEIGGGIYLGTITYADQRQFHLIAGLLSSRIDETIWGSTASDYGITDPDDGLANHQSALAQGGGPAFDYCESYSNSGFSDWYLGARNENALMDALYNTAEFPASPTELPWSSTEVSTDSGRAWVRRLEDGVEFEVPKNSTSRYVRPVRRVAV